MVKENTNNNSNKTSGFKSQYKNNNKNRNPSNNKSVSIINKSKFEGRCNEINGHIIDCNSTKCAEQFNMTMKEVTTYLGKGGGGAYKYPGDFDSFCKTKRIP